jgi:hypothetical protein
MASKITSPSSTGKSGISVSTVNSALATPIAVATPPSRDSSTIIDSPIGPDGKPYIMNEAGTAWVPQSNKPPISNEEINSLTKNGTDTSSILKNGFPTTPEENAPSVPVTLTQNDVPSVFTGNTKLIGQQLWQYKVVLFNHTQRYEVPTRAIKVLCVEDDLLSWPLRGYVIIDSRMEGFERSEDFSLFYFLRSDARDEIRVEIQPIIEQGTLPPRIWNIEMEGVVYDVEDLPHVDMTIKAKKLYFWDKKFQGLLEKNIQWSTATGKRFTTYTKNPPCPAPIAHASDMERSMYTGEAIASILSEAGYESYIDFDKWNWGKSKINFAAKASWTRQDCIEYILAQQISDDGKNDICMLQWNRADVKWNLTPVWSIFEKAGTTSPKELQIEHMFLEEVIAQVPAAVSPLKAPMDMEVSYERDIKSDEYSKIRNYQFSQTSGLDNAKAFVSRPVYSHWHQKKQFDVDVKENEIKTVKDSYFKKNYVDYLLSVKNYPVMAMNLTKTTQQSIDPQFSPISTLDPLNDRSARSLDGRGKILYAGIFLNQNLVIRMTGSTHRLAGTFIGVDRNTTSSDTIYDYQLCGQYLVTNVKHIIQQQKFVNDITMVKVHAYESLPINENVE